jgi:hypothetical protein
MARPQTKEPSMSIRRLSFSLLSSSLLAACTTGSYGVVKSDVEYLEPMASHFVDRAYIHRYACRDNVLLHCECFSRLSPSCLCNC